MISQTFSSLGTHFDSAINAELQTGESMKESAQRCLTPLSADNTTELDKGQIKK